MAPTARESRGKRQTRLAFTSLENSSPGPSSSALPEAAVDFEGSPMKRRRIGRDVATQAAESRERKGNTATNEGYLPTPSRSSQQQSARNGRRHQPVEFDEPSSDSDTAAKKEKKQSKPGSTKKAFSMYGWRRQPQTHPSDDDSSDEVVASSPVPPQSPSARRVTRSSNKDADASYKRRSTRRHKAAIIESEEDESEDVEQKSLFDDIGEPETSGDEVLQSSPMRKSRLRRKGQAQADDEEESIEQPSDKPSDDEQEEEETSLVETPSNRGSITSEAKRRSAREHEELAEDLENLKSSPPPGPSNSSRTQRDVRQSALERLVKQRAGKSKDSTVVGRRQPVMVSSESSEAEDGDDASEHNGSDLEAAYQDDDADDGDFIVEDEEETALGVPEMPLEFSNLSRMKGRHLFKYVVEWMVQKKLNPAFAMDDDIYDLAFKKLDDEVRGLAGSKFTSSAWTRDFTIALQGRPYLAVREIEDPARSVIYSRCEACNRAGHPATFELQFQGKPYIQDTLDDVENDEEDDEEEDDDDDERSEYDSKGRKVPPERTIYHVGQFCMRNAHTAHALEHWRYHLNDFILDYLGTQGTLDPEQIVERDGWKTKKRRKFAEKVVDEMEASGEIQRLYRDFRQEIDDAREAKSAYTRGRNVEDFMYT